MGGAAELFWNSRFRTRTPLPCRVNSLFTQGMPGELRMAGGRGWRRCAYRTARYSETLLRHPSGRTEAPPEKLAPRRIHRPKCVNQRPGVSAYSENRPNKGDFDITTGVYYGWAEFRLCFADVGRPAGISACYLGREPPPYGLEIVPMKPEPPDHRPHFSPSVGRRAFRKMPPSRGRCSYIAIALPACRVGRKRRARVPYAEKSSSP